MTDEPRQRVSAIPAPEEYRLPGRPDAASASAPDAYRQTSFLLGADLDLFADLMNLQLRQMKDAHPSKYRTHTLAGIVALWSRTYFYLSDTVLVGMRGEYPSALPLLRAACEAIAVEQALASGDAEEHNAWLARTLRPNETHRAFEIELGRYFSGETLARDPVLGAVYRPVSDLGRPNFGSSVLQVAPESNNLRVAVTFADTSFHLGWAELTLGWLLALAARQAWVGIEATDVFPVADDLRAAYERLQAAVDRSLARGDRCRIEEVEDDSGRRYLVHNFRRSAGAAPKKIVL